MTIHLSWRTVATILAAVTIYVGDVYLFALYESGPPPACSSSTYQPPSFGRT